MYPLQINMHSLIANKFIVHGEGEKMPDNKTTSTATHKWDSTILSRSLSAFGKIQENTHTGIWFEAHC